MKGPSSGPSYSLLAMWHLLSLDAASVASVWTLFLAWCAGVRLSWTDPAALFLAVWILYAGDRLLDAQPVFDQAFQPELTDRHRFHHAYRGRFVAVMTLAALPLMVLLHHTKARLLHLDVLLACLLGTWLMLVHLRPGASDRAHRLPKELAVGLFFPSAVCLPTLARQAGLPWTLLLPAVCFGLLCTLNCFFLYAWEHPRERPVAHGSARWGARHIVALGTTYTLGTAVLLPAAVSQTGLRHGVPWLCACSLSGALLLSLHAVRSHLRPVTLRATADLLLLTPLPVFAACQWLHG